MARVGALALVVLTLALLALAVNRERATTVSTSGAEAPTLASTAAPPDETLPDQTLPDETLPDQTLPDEPLPDEPLPDEPLTTGTINPGRLAPLAPPDDDEAFLTIMVGRAQYGLADGCELSELSYDLDEVAELLSANGRTATASLPLGYTVDEPAARYCIEDENLTTSWDDLERLTREHGWSFVADSRPLLAEDGELIERRPSPENLSADQLSDQVCTSVDELADRGAVGAWGLFAHPGGTAEAGAQRVVRSCAAFGRQYGSRPNDRATVAAQEHTVIAESVAGGRCAAGDGCGADLEGVDRRITERTYVTPEQLLDRIDIAPGYWKLIQVYRLVEGRRTPAEAPDATQFWDCTSPDSSQHWTSRTELWCAEDFRTLVAGLDERILDANPAQMALLWDLMPSSRLR